ncbi:hemerythrin domain-containing protein [Sphaerisporangium corydalis]|uniref:Hemerythrin domain-containing protein n=1 Tax=Sphaerisporangium corydalis TaxID=1441875 RepID=A0ABV9EAH4_9ACTN|nr:hemerythrin domain-containing protein [Sphaerisporangium corydalis]
MANVFEVLRRDHDEVRHLLAEIEAGAPLVGVSESERLVVRKRQVDRLITEESKHEALEEEYFWPAVRELVSGGRELADKAIRQERRAKFLLEDLIGYDPSKLRYEEMLDCFIDEAREHFAFEEEQVWPELRLVLTPERAEELGTKIDRARRMAPTRPHPHTPPHPGLLKATSPFVGTADRIRDLVSGRGRH